MNSFLSRRATLGLAATIPWLMSACGTARPAGSSILQSAVKPAGFKLADLQLRWQDNSGFDYSVSYLRMKNQLGQSLPTADKDRAKAYMSKVLTLFRNQAVPTTTASLLQAGARFGETHTVVLLPLTGEYSTTGASCRVVIRALIQDSKRKTLYYTDIESRSGWTVAGLYVPDPDEAFVKNFAQALVSTFREAGLLA